MKCIKNTIRNKPLVSNLVFCITAFLLFACGSGGSGSSSSGSSSGGSTGSIAFTLEIQDNLLASNLQIADAGPTSGGLTAENALLLAQAADEGIDCEAHQLGEIEAYVYDEECIQIAEGGPWPCVAHEGTIENVPAGDYRKVVIFATDINSGEYVFRGEEGGHDDPLTVLSGKTTRAGKITLDPLDIPNAPVGLEASDGQFTDRIKLSWQDVKHEDGYKIYQLIPDGDPVEIGDICMDNTVYVVSGLPCTPYNELPILYDYMVRAYNDAGESLDSYEDSGFTDDCPIVKPDPPFNLNASDGSFPGQIRLTWEWAGDGPLDEFLIYRSESPDGPWGEPIARPSADTRNYEDSDLDCTPFGDPPIIYYYMVRAYNSAGLSEESDPDSGFTADFPIDVPIAPFNLNASDEEFSNQIRLTWEWEGVEPLVGFRIYRSGESVPIWDDFFYKKIADSDSRSYIDLGVECGGEWWNYMVRAYNCGGESVDSVPDSGSTAVDCPPDAPINLLATATSTESIKLTWGDAATNETNYRVRRSMSSSGPFEDIGAEALPENTQRYDDIGLDPATTYYYNVQAYNAVSDSGNTIVSAATGCNIEGEWQGSGSETWSGCDDPSDDDTYPGNVVLTIAAQTPDPGNEKDVFDMSVTVTSSFFPGARSELESLEPPKVTLQPNGQIINHSYTYKDYDSDGEVVSRGNGTFSGSVTNNCNRIAIVYSGDDTEGDSCHIEGSFTVNR
jgi:fibronectin type 3 domain-containing protein